MQNNNDLISKAIEHAAHFHAGQVDKGGKPYIFHCLQVMNAVSEKYGITDPDLICIAVLHDTAEDTLLTINRIAVTFGERIADGVDALTKRKGESSEDYLNRVLSNPDAIKVKIEDLRHNMDLTRLPTESFRGDNLRKICERQDKYEDMLIKLRNALKMIV